VPSPIHREINSLYPYGGASLRIALREAAARIDSELSLEARERLLGLFAIDAMAITGA
jgi:hypothetical protein